MTCDQRLQSGSNEGRRCVCTSNSSLCGHDQRPLSILTMCGLMKTPDALDLTAEKYHVLHGVFVFVLFCFCFMGFCFVFASWVFVSFSNRPCVTKAGRVAFEFTGCEVSRVSSWTAMVLLGGDGERRDCVSHLTLDSNTPLLAFYLTLSPTCLCPGARAVSGSPEFHTGPRDSRYPVGGKGSIYLVFILFQAFGICQALDIC